MKKVISIVIPVYNEELGIHELCKRLLKVLDKLSGYTFEIIMVENGSFDNSYKKLIEERRKDKRIAIVQLARNVGTDGGLMAGLHFAKGDAVVMMNADLQDTPDLIPIFLEKWQNGFDIVYGIVKKREKVRLTRKIATFFFYKIIKITTNNLVKENASDFRLLDKKVYKTILAMPEHNKFLRGLIIWTGYKYTGVPYQRPPRYAGESKAYFTAVVKVALNGLFTFSPLPFYIPIFFSFLIFVICLMLIFLHQIISALFAFFFFCVFIMLGIILEYIRRIYVDVQNRPHFTVNHKVGL